MTSPVPPWIKALPAEHPVAGGDWFPHIIGQVPQEDGTILVTWALPGLTTAAVRVPFASWLQGHHNIVGRALAAQVTPLLPRPYAPEQAAPHQQWQAQQHHSPGHE